MVTQKWDYQGGGLVKKESGIKHLVEAYKESNKHGLGYGQPAIGGTSRDGHAVQNAQNELVHSLKSVQISKTKISKMPKPHSKSNPLCYHSQHPISSRLS